MTTSWTVIVEENPDNPEELILPLPQELLDMQGWGEGTTLQWIDNKDGTWSIKKMEVSDGNDF
ncbi:hypothetical protein UFOVP71_252 [uncultured Caudovirales phage]|uniref:Uncharacterized protein n=1 Tax=uncultured Caudovirales phage TaxID=2100421 RepID=A0A6J5TBP3_9CAUD|nr:hypothetical protein UFOVP71_252 [uncultured Caudovirales phage]